jgi:hypothetical protein
MPDNFTNVRKECQIIRGTKFFLGRVGITWMLIYLCCIFFTVVYRTPPNQQRQDGQTEVVPLTPPEAEQVALPDISPTELRATGEQIYNIHTR